MKKTLTAALAAMTALACGATASATTLITTLGGELVGIDDLVVGLEIYDVAFADGSCLDAFGTCDAGTPFAFDNAGDAISAATAIDAALDGTSFDFAPDTVFGCSLASDCQINVVYDADGALFAAVGHVNLAGSVDFLNAAAFGLVTDDFADQTFAVFTPDGVIPVPAAALLFAPALAGLRAFGRRG